MALDALLLVGVPLPIGQAVQLGAGAAAVPPVDHAVRPHAVQFGPPKPGAQTGVGVHGALERALLKG